jgi:hypothetical protein
MKNTALTGKTIKKAERFDLMEKIKIKFLKDFEIK